MHELLKRGESVHFVIYRSKDQQAALEHLVDEYQLSVTWVDNQQQALAYYIDQLPKWVIFGNTFEGDSKLKGICKTALMQHGIYQKLCITQCQILILTYVLLKVSIA